MVSTNHSGNCKSEMTRRQFRKTRRVGEARQRDSACRHLPRSSRLFRFYTANVVGRVRGTDMESVGYPYKALLP